MMLITRGWNKYDEKYSNVLSSLESPSKDKYHSYNSIAGLRNIAFDKYRMQRQKKIEEAELGAKVTEFKNSK